uniref:CheR family methyltransferase n=1 Tax=Cellvibrio fontiphilus TaxID=1815559 RepID=UPI002B4BA87A|nr:CheR family methyltransferase [Cellvibrio fontiphilus]
MNEREFSYRPADFERVRAIIHRKAGIHLADSKKQLVYSRLARRLRVLGLADFSDYLDYLEKNPPEQEEFVNALTTNLTAFFREPHHFSILAAYANKHKNSPARLRVWCAASSTGEEPYSIAMTLIETFGRYDPPVDIIASDIDSNVLAEASRGVYSLSRLQSLSLSQKKQFFLRGKGSNACNAKVIDALKQLVEFKKINLLDKRWPLEGKFDVIFCRNVMIYFDKQTQMVLLTRMMRLLKPEGLYIAGHSESFSHAAHLVRLVDKTTYQAIDSVADNINEGAAYEP